MKTLHESVCTSVYFAAIVTHGCKMYMIFVQNL
jgi:hypothetical protein